MGKQSIAGAGEVKFRHYLEYGGLRVFTAFFKLIGVDRSSALCGRLLRWLGPVSGAQKTAERNLRACMPELSEDRIKTITQEMWENFGRTVGEFAFIPEMAAGHIEVQGQEFIDKALATGRSIIFFSGHFANWEVISPYIRSQTGTLYGVYRAANNPLVDKWIYAQRQQISFDDQLPKGRQGARRMIECVRNHEHIAMLVDQKMNDGIEAPFFGRPSMTASAAALLAIKYDCPLVPVHIERTQGAHVIVRFFEALPIVKTGDRTKDVLTVTTQYNAFLEERIRAFPGQWFWVHKRWAKPKRKKKWGPKQDS